MDTPSDPAADPRGYRTLVARRLLLVAGLVLVVLHIMPMPGDPQRIVLGFVPWELAYALLWTFGAGVFVLYMTGPAWPDEPVPSLQPAVDPEARPDPDPDPDLDPERDA